MHLLQVKGRSRSSPDFAGASSEKCGPLFLREAGHDELVRVTHQLQNLLIGNRGAQSYRVPVALVQVVARDNVRKVLAQDFCQRRVALEANAVLRFREQSEYFAADAEGLRFRAEGVVRGRALNRVLKNGL